MISKFPLELMYRAGAPVRRPSPHSRGWKLRAPHREDRNPSFSVYKVDPSKPDEDPYAWAVLDFADGTSMGLVRYLKEFFGYEAAPSRRRESEREIPVKLKDFVGDTISASIPRELEPIDNTEYRYILNANIAYRKHGFGEVGIDSRKYGIYLNPKTLKPVIFYRNVNGLTTGVKERVDRENAKYIWLAGNGYQFWARREGNRALIVTEGEFKAVLFAWLFPEADVVGVPSRVLLHKVPWWEYKSVLFVLDPDVARDLIRADKLPHIRAIALAGIYEGISVSVLDFQRAFGFKDINDWIVEQDSEPEESRKLARHLVKQHRRHLRPSFDTVVDNLPLLDPEKLSPAAYHFLISMFPYFITDGTWINQHSVKLDTSPLILMQRTKQTRSTLYRAIAELRDLGVLKHERGYLESGGGKRPTLTLNLHQMRKLLLRQSNPPTDTGPRTPDVNGLTSGLGEHKEAPDPRQTHHLTLTQTPNPQLQPQTGSGHSIHKVSIPKRKSVRTLSLKVLFNRLEGCRITGERSRNLMHVTRYLLGIAGSKTIHAITELFGNLSTAFASAVALARYTAQEHYRLLSRALRLLDRAMPGFRLYGRHLEHPMLNGTIPASYLYNGTLIHEPGRAS